MQKFEVFLTQTRTWRGVLEANDEAGARAKAQRIVEAEGTKQFEEGNANDDDPSVGVVEVTDKPVNVIEDDL
jgi:hypothetical protein